MKKIKIKPLLKIRVIAAILLLSSLLSAIAEGKSDTVSFLHITDPHICNLAGYHPSFIERRQHYGEGAEPLKDFLMSVPGKTQSDFVVITGDMIDFFEAETARGDMLDTEVEQFVRHLEVSNIPVYMTLGNHDIASYWVTSGSSYNSSQLNAGRARASWIRNAECFRNGTYYSRTVEAGNTTYRLIFLDNAYYSPERGEGASPYLIDKYQLLWLEDQLKISENDVELIFMHMPLISPASEDLQLTLNTYFVDYADTVAIKYDLRGPDNDLFDLTSILERNSSARIVFSGHRHSSTIHDVQLNDEYSLIHVMSGSFGRDPRNWRLVQLTPESVIISHLGEKTVQFVIPVN